MSAEADLDNADITGDTIVNRNTESPEALPLETIEPVVVPDLSPAQESPDLPEGTSGSPEPLLSKEDEEEEGNISTVVVNLSSQNESKGKDNSLIKEKEDIVDRVAKEEVKEEEEKDDEKKKKEKVPVAAIWKLFSYATALDWVLMLFGALAATIHGAALPAFVIVFGDFIDIFTNQAITQGFLSVINATSFSNGTFDCTDIYNNTLPDNIGAIGNFDHGLSCDSLINGVDLTTVYLNCFPGRQCLDNGGFIREINKFVFIFLGIAAGVFIFATIQISLFQAACERQIKKIRLAFYRAILRQEIGWFDANPSAELSSRIADDVDKIHDGIGDKVALLIQWLATFFGGFIVAFIYNWKLTLILVAFSPLLVIAGGLMSTFTSQFSSKEQKQYASAGGVAEEVLSSIRTVVAFGGEKKETVRYDGKLKEARAFGAKKGFTIGLSSGFVFFVFFALDSVAFWFGAYLLSIEDDDPLTPAEITPGTILTVFFAVLIGAFSLGQAGPNGEVLLTAAGAAGTIFEIITRKSLIDPSSEEGEKPEKFDGSVEFKDIFFSYPTRSDVEVLDGLSLKVEVGKTYALVGPSGCGKSTVIQLLQRFYDPNAGEVLLGGKDIRTLNTKWLRQNIGVVSQEPVLFDTTIAENILYGKEGATREEMKTAAVNANAHDFISELPDGYETLVGEAGTQLSGGQKQRVAIARALIRDPKILLLDEATSALDTQSESVVQQALDRARAGRTTIVIAHRLSTIQNADVIASIQDGRVVESGSHSELMDNEGLYCELVTAQSFGIDEGFSFSSPRRLLSSRGSRRGRGSESESSEGIERQQSFKKQNSYQKQTSIKQQESSSDGTVPKILTQKEKMEMWDKEIPEVSLFRIIKTNAPEWWIILLGLLGAAVNGAVFPSFALFFGEVLSVFTLPKDEILASIHVWAALFLVLGIVSGIAIFLKITCFTVAGENLTSRLRSISFKSMLRQEIGWYDDERNSSGALTTRLADDAAKVQGATGSRLGTLLETCVSMLMAIIVAFVYSWVLTLLILAVVPIMLIASTLEVKALSGHTVANKKALESAGKIAVDSISNVRTVASLSLEGNFNAQYAQNVEKPFRRAMLNTMVYGITYAFSQGVIFLMYAVVFRFGAFQITLPDSNIASASFDDIFVVFFALVFGAAGAGQAGAFTPNYAKAKLSANRIFHLIDREPVIDSYSEEGTELEKVSGTVEVQEVKFNYPSRPDVTVLQGLSVSVNSGETLALVGPSGCGKSTVVSLIERFYNPNSGVLNLDGTNISDLNISWIRRQIGIVSQEPVLFDRSIADNIRYGANYREVSSEEVIEAAKAANIHNFVESLPQGYNTNVGAKGTQLSGGQKQRIAIARALVRDPKILLLDEATSALDTESEKIVQEALDKARVGRTSIVIAHRLSTIFNADCIAVISGGKVIEKGTHKELIDLKGLYYKLNRFQMVPGIGDKETPVREIK